jgi:hypothetical protein
MQEQVQSLGVPRVGLTMNIDFVPAAVFRGQLLVESSTLQPENDPQREDAKRGFHWKQRRVARPSPSAAIQLVT